MGRLSAPWKWEARNGWYAWISGRRVRLCPIKDGVTRARKKLAELQNAALGPDPAAIPLVAELVFEYFANIIRKEQSGEMAVGAKANAVQRLRGFVERWGDLPSNEIRTHHVEAWLNSRTTWGPTMRHDGAGAVKAMFSWALTQGRIDANPIASLKKPSPKRQRDRIPTTATVDATLDAVLIPGLRDILIFIFETGCRPKEARDLEAKHIDFVGGVVSLDKHKTAKKTHKNRTIYLTPVAIEIARRSCEATPKGPIFRNSRGGPWTACSLSEAVSRVRKRTGADASMVAYGLRHLFITDGAAKGISGPILAELAGHSDLKTLATYNHVSERHESLKDAVVKIRES